jgi:hypothetical protein
MKINKIITMIYVLILLVLLPINSAYETTWAPEFNFQEYCVGEFSGQASVPLELDKIKVIANFGGNDIAEGIDVNHASAYLINEEMELLLLSNAGMIVNQVIDPLEFYPLNTYHFLNRLVLNPINQLLEIRYEYGLGKKCEQDVTNYRYYVDIRQTGNEVWEEFCLSGFNDMGFIRIALQVGGNGNYEEIESEYYCYNTNPAPGMAEVVIGDLCKLQADTCLK